MQQLTTGSIGENTELKFPIYCLTNHFINAYVNSPSKTKITININVGKRKNFDEVCTRSWFAACDIKPILPLRAAM